MRSIFTSKFCEPCKLFQNGAWTYNEEVSVFTHHETAASFQQALELGCILCTRLQSSFEPEDRVSVQVIPSDITTKLGSTTYERAPVGSGVNEAVAVFRLGTYVARLVLEQHSELEDSAVLMSTNTGERGTLDFLITQNKQCLAEHTECQQRVSDFIPTRLVDVGLSTDPIVRLCQRDDIPQEAQYIALSHCWGKSRPVTLLKSNILASKHGIAVTSLPKTFQDAIKVTRAFEHRYIWIDSLCIIQDDADDWRAEASQMRNVYRNAAFCIAATAAVSGTVGLFFDRDIQSLEPFQLALIWRDHDKESLHEPIASKGSFAWPDAYTHIDCAPLNQRSWVAQERYLSPKILHFAHKFVFWECPDGITCETHPDEVPGWLQSGNIVDNLYSLKKVVSGIQPPDEFSRYPDHPDEVYWFWCKFRTLYTSFQLTKESDILVALAGIAQDVAERLDDDMVVGMWRKRLIEDMCWSIKLDTSKPWRPARWRAPSWSWASSRQVVKASRLGYDLNTEVRDMCNVLDVRLETNTLGDLVRGTVVLEGKIVPWVGASHISDSGARSTAGFDTPPTMKITLDEPVDLNVNEDHWLIVLQSHFMTKRKETMAEGIVVKLCENTLVTLGSYKRVGHFRDFGSEVLDLFYTQEEQVIELV